MVTYTCFRCGYECYQKGMLLKHLSRKKQCFSKLQEIDNIKILQLNKIEQYNKNTYNIPINKTLSSKNSNLSSQNEDINLQIIPKSLIFNEDKSKTNVCKLCKKSFSNYKNKWRHEKKCTVLPTHINDKITKILKENNDLKKQVLSLTKKLEKKEKIINKTIINNNYIDNRKIVNYHLDYKEFGFETVDHLDDKYINNFLANPSKKIAKYIKDVYFNRDYPLNQTVRILDLKSGTGFIYEDNQWKMKSIKSITEKILRESLDKITSFNYDKKNYIKYEDVIEINDKDADNIDLSEEEKSTWFIVNETTEKYKLKLKNKKQDIEHIVKNYLEELTKKLNKHYTDNHTDKLDI